MSDSELLDRFCDAYRQLADGDAEALLGLMATDVVYHLPGKHLGGGDARGHRELMSRIARAMTYCTSGLTFSLEMAWMAGPFLISLERFYAARDDLIVEQRVCVVWRTDSGLVVEIWAHFEDQAAVDMFWSESSG